MHMTIPSNIRKTTSFIEGSQQFKDVDDELFKILLEQKESGRFQNTYIFKSGKRVW